MRFDWTDRTWVSDEMKPVRQPRPQLMLCPRCKGKRAMFNLYGAERAPCEICDNEGVVPKVDLSNFVQVRPSACIDLK